jgi:RNA exonuclease 1
MLKDVTTTLKDIQAKLLDLLHPRTILIGHSLNSDLTALKLTHPYIIDTTLLFPHPRGPPLKSSLKYLAQKYLSREIQKGHGSAGHNSIEDARTCLDLVKQKCEKGKAWGNSDAAGENIFRRVARVGVQYKSQGGSAIAGKKSSAAVDWGDPRKGAGGGATFTIGCQSDEEVVTGVKRAVLGDHDGKEIPGGGVDFVWARLRELEALKGWWNNNRVVAKSAEAESEVKPVEDSKEVAVNETTTKTIENVPSTTDQDASLPIETSSLPAISEAEAHAEATTKLTNRIHEIYTALPPCTAFIIYSGSGDPREMSRLQAMQQTFKREYKVKKWDQLSVKWTDTEEQALKKAVQEARKGIAFVCVK